MISFDLSCFLWFSRRGDKRQRIHHDPGKLPEALSLIRPTCTDVFCLKMVMLRQVAQRVKGFHTGRWFAVGCLQFSEGKKNPVVMTGLRLNFLAYQL